VAAIWKGAISFGLVNIPVELVAAVKADHVSFRMLDAATKSPVKYERVRATDGKTIPWSEIVKGYEYAKGQFIVLTDEDFKAAALESSKRVDILDFVPAAEIDPRYFETPYFLLPTQGGDRPYALLREAMRGMDVVAVGKIIMRQHQHLAGLHVVGNALVLELMRFASEVVDAERYAFPPASQVRPQERGVAVQLIKSLLGTFDPEKYTDEYRANLQRIIQAKSKGKKVSLAAPPATAHDAGVLDLMAKLKQSLAPKRRSASSGPATAKKAASKSGQVAGKIPAKRSRRASA
jgi:DNA end-binding protein Ku